MPVPLITRLKRARRKRGITQAELAVILGITTLSVGRWEAGTRNIGLRNIPNVLHFIKTGEAK